MSERNNIETHEKYVHKRYFTAQWMQDKHKIIVRLNVTKYGNYLSTKLTKSLKLKK
jgi:hypothetical protein